MAWSPDDASLALGLFDRSEVQIWNVSKGQLTASFTDPNDLTDIIGALAWSADGKYLAESASMIHLWDAQAQKIVATFGRVDNAHFILTLAWSLDNSMLASTTNALSTVNPTQDTVNVWKLS